MAFAGRQFQSLRRSFRRSTRKRNYTLNDPVVSETKKRKTEDDENLQPVSNNFEDFELQKKIDVEIKMREGTKKLLAACNREQQMLQGSKSLLVSDTRVLAYMSELQKRKTAEYEKQASPAKSGASSAENGSGMVPCKGKLAVSDIRIPLFWRDVDHIRNRGDHHRYAVFCLLKVGTDIFDTQLVTNVDRTSTDVTFSDSFVFENVSPGFEFTLEVYSYNLHDDMTIASTPQKIRRKINSFSNSVGKSVGRKLQTSLSSGSNEELVSVPTTPGTTGFRLVARSTLTLDEANTVIKTHDLNMENDESTRHHCLPLFGNFCCRFAAQPDCIAKDLAQGSLQLLQTTAGVQTWRNLRGVLRDGDLRLRDEEVFISEDPVYTIPISKDTLIAASSKSSVTHPHVLEVSENKERHHLAVQSKEEMSRWRDALEQLVTNQGAWNNACHTSEVIIIPDPRRPSVESDRTGSLYDEMSISPDFPSQDGSEEDAVFNDSPANNLRPRPVKLPKPSIFYIPKMLSRRETNV
ncbi:rhotekin-like isoform X2 [Asterias amurensis]|uniref:rhotekin-like isoform X2 n=1 Tax=Asterias amurensis TaxID=7602 RepID=UPI003AB718FD